jgi:adenylate cyclase
MSPRYLAPLMIVVLVGGCSHGDSLEREKMRAELDKARAELERARAEVTELKQQTTKSEQQAARDAAFLTNVVDTYGTYYSASVVDRLREAKVVVTHDYKARPGAVPLTPTFAIEAAQLVTEKSTNGGAIRLYSDYPFRSRQDGGPVDAFEKEAIQQLRKLPDQPFVRKEDWRGRPALRYATAQRMSAGCVNCHNTHADSPKRDWKVGDVRGVLEIILPLK